MNNGFLSGLLASIQSGARGTMDAFEQDVDKVKAGRLPDHAMDAIGQMLGAYTPNTGLKPSIPANSIMRKVFDSQKGWGKAPMEHPSVDPFLSILMNAQPGTIREMVLKALRAQEKTGIRP